MSVYKYTLLKYMKSISTWIITAVSIFVIVFLSGYIAFHVGAKKINTSPKYVALIIGLVSGMTTFLSVFVSVFSSFKSATMFRDEVEDGSFLVVLSKPVSRSRIVFEKWLALQTVLVSYTFILAFTFAITIFAFDNGASVKSLSSFYGLKPLKSNIVVVSAFMFLILTVMSLIFSSISILLSTKISVGSTIGIATALGILIPITGLVSTFTSKNEVDFMSKARFNYSYILEKYRDQIKDMINIAPISDKLKEKILNEEFSFKTSDAASIYNLAIPSGDHDSFKTLWPLDFNYQLSQLSRFSTNETVSNATLDAASEALQGRRFTYRKYVVDNKDVLKSQQVLENLLIKAWNENKPIRDLVFTIVTVEMTGSDEFKNYVNDAIAKKTIDKGILTAYLNKSTWDDDVTNQMKADLDNFVNETQTGDAIIRANKFRTFISDIAYYASKQFDKLFPYGLETRSILSGQSFVMYDYFRSHNVDINTLIHDNEWEVDSNIKLTDGNKDKYPLLLLQGNTQGNKSSNAKNDWSMFAKINTLMKNGIKFSNGHFEDYANKNNILIFYIVIAIALVPLSYLIVRRQNFR